MDGIGTHARELDVAITIAKRAGEAIFRQYEAHTAAEYEKKDGSPVTDADLEADSIIRTGLLDAFPDDPHLTEESIDDGVRLSSRRVWIVDPLDGTAQFIGRTGEFDVMIALVEDHEAVVGVIYQPTTRLLYWAVRGEGAWREADGVTERVHMGRQPGPPVIGTSIYYGADTIVDTLAVLVSALGVEDVLRLTVGYQPRRVVPPTRQFDAFVGLWTPDLTHFAREWDLAAPQLFTFEAGGALTDAWGNPYRFNQPDTQISRGLIAANDRDLHARLIALLADTPPVLSRS
jgi:3'-phosphoadenosine 5'-phosphosulfate (PAPS) 3'-phosphatase